MVHGCSLVRHGVTIIRTYTVLWYGIGSTKSADKFISLRGKQVKDGWPKTGRYVIE